MQLLERIQMLHDMGILHLDIKPDNVCLSPEIGNGSEEHYDKYKEIYLIDFGICRRWNNARTKEHI